MAHIAYMALGHRKMPLAHAVCDSVARLDSTLLREDWVAPPFATPIRYRIPVRYPFRHVLLIERIYHVLSE